MYAIMDSINMLIGSINSYKIAIGWLFTINYSYLILRSVALKQKFKIST